VRKIPDRKTQKTWGGPRTDKSPERREPKNHPSGGGEKIHVTLNHEPNTGKKKPKGSRHPDISPPPLGGEKKVAVPLGTDASINKKKQNKFDGFSNLLFETGKERKVPGGEHMKKSQDQLNLVPPLAWNGLVQAAGRTHSREESLDVGGNVHSSGGKKPMNH